MGKFLIFALASAGAAALAAPDFADAHKILRDASQIGANAAQVRALTAREAGNLDALAASARAHLKHLEAEVEAARASNAAFAAANSEISAEVKSGAAALAELSRYLDGAYAKMAAEAPRGAKRLFAATPAQFAAKPAPEKLRALLRILSEMSAIDKAVAVEGNTVSTGLFPRFSGEISGDVSMLKAEGGK